MWRARRASSTLPSSWFGVLPDWHRGRRSRRCESRVPRPARTGRAECPNARWGTGAPRNRSLRRLQRFGLGPPAGVAFVEELLCGAGDRAVDVAHQLLAVEYRPVAAAL